MTEKPLVVQGGTLIDGTGRAPVADAVIVIEKGRFKSVGKNGEVAIPQEAQILDAKGKTVLLASSMVTVIWRTSTANFICTSASQLASRLRSIKTAHGAWRRSRAPSSAESAVHESGRRGAPLGARAPKPTPRVRGRRAATLP